MKTAIYMRVSTDKQNTEMQEREISLFLQLKGITNEIRYTDKDESGLSTSRPALDSLLNDCKLGKVDTLIVWKMDRLFRSLGQLIIQLNSLNDMGVSFISIKDDINMTTANGRLHMHIIGAVGEYEREMIVMRVKAGLANAKAKGQKLGPKYKIAKELREKAIELRRSGMKYKDVSIQTGLKISTIQQIWEASNERKEAM